MAKPSDKFLKAVLGATGAKALGRTTAIEPTLENYLVPRVALSWVLVKKSYEGSIPGQENSYVKFGSARKGLSGVVSFDDGNYSFENQTPEHVAAAIALSVGAGGPTNHPVRNVVVTRLGKAVDSLVQAEQLAKNLGELLDKKQLDPTLGYNIQHEKVEGGWKVNAFDKQGQHVGTAWFHRNGNELKPITVGVHEDHQRKGLATAMYNHVKSVSGINQIAHGDLQTDEGSAFRNTYKTELPGRTHQPTKQQGPEEPEAPQKQPKMTQQTQQQSLKPKLPKLSPLKIEKSEMEKECKSCGRKQFKNSKFVGCMCHRDLAKNIKTVIYSDGVVLEFGGNVPMAVASAIRKAVKD
jgi:hypothetical protein